MNAPSCTTWYCSFSLLPQALLWFGLSSHLFFLLSTRTPSPKAFIKPLYPFTRCKSTVLLRFIQYPRRRFKFQVSTYNTRCPLLRFVYEYYTRFPLRFNYNTRCPLLRFSHDTRCPLSRLFRLCLPRLRCAISTSWASHRTLSSTACRASTSPCPRITTWCSTRPWRCPAG